ncbi:MAG: hypothetical protein QNJ05_07725 [Woeseiaceae bacterium]|nr:hypothetical protein [Woeseiaceae bacterium]
MNTDERQERELLDLLKDYPAPQADAGFYDRALLKAAHRGARKQRNRWLATGFGSALAAGLAAWVVFAFLLGVPVQDASEPTIPGVTIALEEPKTIRLMFASKQSLDNAMLTVSLPDGVELSGFPGQKEITWETSLVEGRNVLPLTLVALTPAGGEVFARLEHGDKDQVFRLKLNIS